jgi:hypothetical protein
MSLKTILILRTGFLFMMSGFHRDVYEICALLGFFFFFLDFLTLEDGTDRLSRNISKELPLYAA